jgi:decaprenylphospho-beta-D-erythro-pentofuranosid-2-ulose 2-reductase
MSDATTPEAPRPPRRRAAIFGATSGIASAVARRLAEAGAELVLVARDTGALEAAAADLRIRGAARVETVRADLAARTEALRDAEAAAWDALGDGGLDLALIAYGSLPDQRAAEADPHLAEAALQLNFVSPCLLSGLLAQRFEARRAGTIAVVTSVAGDRGRRSNYVYGAAKGGLQRYLEGLRHRLAPAGARVLDIRPGFVSTRMTAHLPQTGPLWATSDRVAGDILRAVDAGRDVLYTPWFWRGVMLGVRSLPRPLFHRTPL